MRCQLLLSAALLLGACFRPSLPSGRYQCSASADCPAGLECLGGLCYRPGEVDLAGAPEDPQDMDDGDASIAVMPDMTVLDFRDPLVDFREADLTSVPCTGAGTRLLQTVYACRGNFTNATQQRALCGLGFHICEARDVLSLQTAGLTASCAAVGGFFAARISAANPNKMSINCPPKTNDTTAALVGCGSETGTTSFNNAACYGLNAAFICKPAMNAEWSCTTSGLDGATHNNTMNKGGVLCCAD